MTLITLLAWQDETGWGWRWRAERWKRGRKVKVEVKDASGWNLFGININEFPLFYSCICCFLVKFSFSNILWFWFNWRKMIKWDIFHSDFHTVKHFQTVSLQASESFCLALLCSSGTCCNASYILLCQTESPRVVEIMVWKFRNHFQIIILLYLYSTAFLHLLYLMVIVAAIFFFCRLKFYMQ